MPRGLKRAAFFCNDGSWESGNVPRVYGALREQIQALTDCYPVVVTTRTFDEHAPRLGDLEVVFSTWGMPALSAEQLDCLPDLRAVFYAAGSVQGFARPLLQRGILVSSAWAANAVPVAEFTLAQILLANKGYFRNTREYCEPQSFRSAFRGRGNLGALVALLGAGQIGHKVVELLRPFRLNVLVFDPFLSVEDAALLGVENVTLEEAFRRGQVVSNHLANLPATAGMLHGGLFEMLPPGATFINTGRGQTVVEAELIQVLRSRPDVFALLDVTYPEPPAAGSPLYELPNVYLTSHIAGSIGDEVLRLAEYMLAEFQAWEEGRPLRYAVSLEQLETMA
jgi:phosphoglycerate dehydrogenase-like enzyme